MMSIDFIKFNYPHHDIGLLLSIVIPIFKERGYLAKTLKALTLQTIIKKCEIILAEYKLNWGTEFYTQEIVRDFIEKYHINARIIDVFKPGIAYARNEGVVASSGEFFVNFDADARFNTKFALERISDALENGAAMTVCDNEFDYTGLPKDEFQQMVIPQRALDCLNNGQILGWPCLEPGSAFQKQAFIDVGGFNDIPQNELFILGPRFIFKFGQPFHIPGVSVIVSPRRALKLRELGLGTLNYGRAIRGQEVLQVGNNK